MIPKIIHYCWFGGKPIPRKNRKCIESWKKFCPDYEIKQWNEKNYDIEKNAYMCSAYKEKKWGFVPDYARFDIIYNEGGFYLDTDVELLKSLDELRENEAYMGFEEGKWINAGLGFGSNPKNETIKNLRDMYNNISFYNSSGDMNLVASPSYITDFLKKIGLQCNNKMQLINTIKIYPTEYFAGKDYLSGKITKTEKSISIHHYDGSWLSFKEKFKLKVKHILGKKIVNLIILIKKKIHLK